MKNKNRWPASLHAQTEAVFHSIRSIRKSKTDTTQGIRSFGSWKIYRYEAHRFVKFMLSKGRTSILNIQEIHFDMADYLAEQLDRLAANNGSRQTMKTILSALGKFEFAINHYTGIHIPGHPVLNTGEIRKEFYTKSKKILPKSNKTFENRAYPDPIALIEVIDGGTFQLQASLQYEGGLRAEGVGAPSNRRLKNPLTGKSLRGIVNDPVTGFLVGVVASIEKGGQGDGTFCFRGNISKARTVFRATRRAAKQLPRICRSR